MVSVAATTYPLVNLSLLAPQEHVLCAPQKRLRLVMSLRIKPHQNIFADTDISMVDESIGAGGGNNGNSTNVAAEAYGEGKTNVAPKSR